MINTMPHIRGACSAPILNSYPGGKNSSYHHIINQMPPHRVYIEPFLGSGAIMRRKLPARLNIGIDLDKRVLPGLIGRSDDGCRPTSSNMTIGSRNAKSDDASARTAVTPEIAMPATTPEITMPSNIVGYGDASSDYVYIQAEALSFLSSCRLRGDEFIYLDPPYLMTARKSKRDLYFHEFGSEKEHIDLLSLVRSLTCMIMISGYWSQLYADMLSDWRTVSFQAHTRQGMATEWLWMNYSEPLALHDYRYLGDSFRERERIKRKAKRWVNRFLSLDHLERCAIVSELNATAAAPIVKSGEAAVSGAASPELTMWTTSPELAGRASC